MKRVVTHESLAHITHLKNVLEHSGIACVVKNTQLSGALGEIPFLECLPELWVVADSDEPRATAILAELETPEADAKDWRCGGCDELNEAQFAACWNCGRAAPAS